MTREEFKKILESNRCSFEEEGDKIVVTGGGGISLIPLETLPPDVVFKNRGYVWLDNLKTLSGGLEFRNKGHVDLISLETLPPGVLFENEGAINLESLIGGWFNEWEGVIEGIGPNRLLNKMIADGVFDRR